MNFKSVNRRTALKTLGVAAGAAVIGSRSEAAISVDKNIHGFEYSLNMSTIRGQNLGFVKELETAAKAGFTSVEIWLDTLQAYLKNGGSITEAKKIADGLGITIQNAIGFAPWIVDDETVRKQALTQLQGEMDLLAKLGCKRIAAPPAGATKGDMINLDAVTERYNTILTMGRDTGVIPQLEMWGGSVNLKHISQVLYVALQSGHPDARVLLDVFHIYKGQSAVESLQLLGKPSLEIFHVNDYPSGINPVIISEPDRVYPGDGVAPLKRILQLVKHPEKPLIISCEVFNKNYYAQDALRVAQTALRKMKAVTADI